MTRPLSVQPLTDYGLGALVSGIELHQVVSETGIRTLIELLHRFGVLWFPNQALDAGSLQAVSIRLGRPESVRPIEHRLADTEYIRLQSNIPGVGVSGGGIYWHSDGSWKPEPTAATILFCAVAPIDGGAISFVDGRTFYRELEPTLRRRANSEYGFHPCHQILRDELAAMAITDDAMLADAIDVRHPLVRVHPSTGDRALILNERWLRPEGDNAAAFLGSLYARLDHCGSRYDHRWTHGDVLIWDNWVVMHRASPVPEGQQKVTWRVTLERLARQICVESSHKEQEPDYHA